MMSTHNKSVRGVYRRPGLTSLGAVRELTAAGSGMMSEGKKGKGGMKKA